MRGLHYFVTFDVLFTDIEQTDAGLLEAVDVAIENFRNRDGDGGAFDDRLAIDAGDLIGPRSAEGLHLRRVGAEFREDGKFDLFGNIAIGFKDDHEPVIAGQGRIELGTLISDGERAVAITDPGQPLGLGVPTEAAGLKLEVLPAGCLDPFKVQTRVEFRDEHPLARIGGGGNGPPATRVGAVEVVAGAGHVQCPVRGTNQVGNPRTVAAQEINIAIVVHGDADAVDIGRTLDGGSGIEPQGSVQLVHFDVGVALTALHRAVALLQPFIVIPRRMHIPHVRDIRPVIHRIDKAARIGQLEDFATIRPVVGSALGDIDVQGRSQTGVPLDDVALIAFGSEVQAEHALVFQIALAGIRAQFAADVDVPGIVQHQGIGRVDPRISPGSRRRDGRTRTGGNLQDDR